MLQAINLSYTIVYFTVSCFTIIAGVCILATWLNVTATLCVRTLLLSLSLAYLCWYFKLNTVIGLY
jgi:hypothetical protein